jgi:hypothetical protein
VGRSKGHLCNFINSMLFLESPRKIIKIRKRRKERRERGRGTI